MVKSKKIASILKDLPLKPGVYRFYDKTNRLIYVGKAKKLKNRVSSYFNKIKYENAKTRVMVGQITDLDYIVVDTEYDALLLENALITKHQPKYNIQWRDDKSYPFICIKNEPFPRVFSTRRVIKDGSEYYGPYASVKMMKTILNLVHNMYKTRTCSLNLTQKNIEAGKFRICLEYHMGNCKAPCEAKQTEEDYNESISAIRDIIKGNISSLIRTLKDQMQKQAENLEFEAAAETKKKIDNLEKYKAKSTVVNPSIHNVDVFSAVDAGKSAFINFMKVNNGSIIQSHTTEVKKGLDESLADLLALTIINIQNEFNSTSREIFVSELIEIEIPDVSVHLPQRGDKKKLLDLSLKNARFFMMDRFKQMERTDPERHVNRLMDQMKKDLRLTEQPRHIECFDNSNFQGTFPVSACVVFKNGKPAKKEYRKYNIKTVEGPNDFASMEEVVYRRYKKLIDEGESLPQLIVIDGGKGQLSSSVKALKKLGIYNKLAIIGIAKKLEEIFFPGDSLPIFLDKRSETLKVIQNLRNEAHRFSITFHRQKRSKAAVSNQLEQIEGIGPKTATTLLREFGSVKRVKAATPQQLEKAVGLKKAKIIIEGLKEKA